MKEQINNRAALNPLRLPDLSSNQHSNNARDKPVQKSVHDAVLADRFCILADLVAGDKPRYQANSDVAEAGEQSSAPVTHLLFSAVLSVD